MVMMSCVYATIYIQYLPVFVSDKISLFIIFDIHCDMQENFQLIKIYIKKRNELQYMN